MTNDLGNSLSPRARSVWAKSAQNVEQSMALEQWLPLYQHLDDAAGIAALLWDNWAPLSVRELLAGAFGGAEPARRLLIWLAGTHDVGKASPAFAMQVADLAQDMSAQGLTIDSKLAGTDDRKYARHEVVSFLALRAWLMDKHGFTQERAGQIASIAAAHHGRPTDDSGISNARDRPHAVGTGTWTEVREEFLDAAEASFLRPADFDAWRSAQISQPALVVLSGLVITADWIASSELFQLAEPGKHPLDTTAHRVSQAWRELDFPSRWSASTTSHNPAEMLKERFDLPPGATPHETQVSFINRALEVDRPELMILEAEMGSGKTEAALLAAEVLAERFSLAGIFVGLPTQATADGMFSRVLSWADRLELETPVNVFLAHGRPELNPDYAKKLHPPRFRSIAQDSEQATSASSADDGSLLIAHRWFSSPRRGPLANFVVGTVDQALFAGLRSRYVMLRHLALAGKVVVIDEVHAYDEYMGQFLTRVLEWLGAYQVPVILLSATLPAFRRKEFLAAYDRGRAVICSTPTGQPLSWAERRRLKESAAQSAANKYAAVAQQLAYPVICSSNHAGPPAVRFPQASRPARSVLIERIDDSSETLIACLREALREGGSVAVMRNTVSRAQDAAALLRTAFPHIPVTLAHSRFLALDRARKDRELVDRYGRDGERPETSIVVATQVIEQSLDVDFDLIFSDVAPIDLLIQRSGRMHRHVRDHRPPALSTPRLILTGADWDSAPPTFEKGSEHVYGKAVLLRTVAALRDRTHVVIPDEIPLLVESVYGNETADIPAQWREALDDADRAQVRRSTDRISRAQSYRLRPVAESDPTLIGWINGPDVDPELTPPGQGTVRDGEVSLEVIVLQRDDDGTARTPSWLREDGGQVIPPGAAPDRRLTRVIQGCFLRLPAGMCYGDALDRHIEELERSFDFPYWHTNFDLKGELVLELDSRGQGRLGEFQFSYTAEDGLTYTR